MPKMTAREAAEKLRKYYYPQESICARQEAYIKCEHVWEEYILILPTITNRPPIFSHDFETCFGVLDRLIAAGKVKSGIPPAAAPEIDPEEYGRINHDDERCLCGQITEDGGLCPECLQVQADHMADLKENR